MEISFAAGLDDGRPLTPIGRVRAATGWRAAGAPDAEAVHRAAIEALKREAAEYGADAVVDVRFELHDVEGADIGTALLQRILATGLAVRFAKAA